MIIYKITNKLNGKSYIGQTVRSLSERWAEHRKKTSDCMAISNAIHKHGASNFEVVQIYKANSLEELNLKEQEYIEEFKTMRPNGYNLTTGGLNYIRSEETKHKSSKRQMGRGNHRFGKKASKQTRLKMSLAHSGDRNHFFGKTHTKETCEKLSEYRANQKCPRTGTKHSPESLKKMSQSHKGVPASNRVPVKCNENGVVYETVTHASRVLGLDPSEVSKQLKGKRKTCKGYTFTYAS